MAAAGPAPGAVPATAPAATSPEPHNAKSTADQAAKPANALTPPTSEELNHDVKKEPDESDLSELDLDDDEEEEEDIEPDHYWDGGRIPVFKPTMEQFRSFKKFVDRIDKYGMRSGIVKVIPPKEWRDSLPPLDENIKRIKIKNPITQEFNGTQGIYTQQNVEKQRSYTLPEWKALTEETQHQPPAKRGERRRNQEKVVRAVGAGRSRVSSTTPAAEGDNTVATKRRAGRPAKKKGKEDDVPNDNPSEPKHNSRQNLGTSELLGNSAPKDEKKSRSRPSKSSGAGQAKSVTSRRLNNTAVAADYVDEEAFKNFKYNIEDLDEYTPERCAELESHYWRSLGFNQPMYAADMPGSLFDDTTESWNVAKLENLLDVLGTKVPGVNTAYLYMGMWKATFAWHLEDVDLYSINYIHFGAPKQWYSISQEDARKFEKAMKSVWPVDSKNCDQFLRHKTYLISPDVLQKQYGVKVNKLVHYEGEFVITFPYGYHSGYNIGYNCAESVNFATESWLDYGKIARKCNCEADNVWVDVWEIERKLRGEPTPEYIEETDDSGPEDEDGHLPSPPASVRGKVATKKRKRGPKQPEPKKKKKIRIKLRLPTREPCVMCPNENPWEPLLPTENGKKAHRSCASYTPETYIVSLNGKDIVYGTTTIDRARLDLRCNFCRSKRGACFQCNAKKCTRAFHATCALAAGVQIDGGLVPTFGEDGTEYYDEGFDFRCKYHRPKMPKNLVIESLETSKRITSYAKELKPNDVIQAQLVGSDVFAGLVLENRPGELSVFVQVLPDGERVEVEWKWLCVLDPEQSHRLKPSPNAIPLPVGMNKSTVSITNRQDGIPTQDEPFHDSQDFKWQEFYNIEMPPQGYAVSTYNIQGSKVDIDDVEGIFHYIPSKSTEARPAFADKPGSDEVAPRSNFLERVQPKPVYQYQGPRKSNNSAPRPVQPLAKHTNVYRPYIYRPKESTSSTDMWTVDQQALANQRSFLEDNTLNIAPSQHVHQPSPSSQGTGILRSFPTDQYYSARTLPAAYPGEHSAFREAARRESQGSHSMIRPGSSLGIAIAAQSGVRAIETGKHSLTQNSTGQTFYESQFNPAAATHAAQLPNTHSSSASRPSSSSASYQSPYGGPLTPATTYSNISTLKPHDVGGGLHAAFQPGESTTQNNRPQTPTTAQRPAPDAVPARQADQWSPPSVVWDRAGLSNRLEHNPTDSIDSALQRPSLQAYTASQDLQRQIDTLPSTASRDGAQARLMRDQGVDAMITPMNFQTKLELSSAQPIHNSSFNALLPEPIPDAIDPALTQSAPQALEVAPEQPGNLDGPFSRGGGYGYGSTMPHA